MNGLVAGGSTAVHIITTSTLRRRGDPHPDAEDQRHADGEQGGHEEHVGQPAPAMEW